jgi:hypothetical protein
MSGDEFEDNGGYPATQTELFDKRGQTSGDRLIKKDGTTSSKHMAVAHLAAAGSPQNLIAESLGMSPAWVCTVLSQTEIKAAIKDIQERHFGENIEKRFRASVHKAMDVMEGVIANTEAKDRDRMQASQWVLEKVTGKATQTVEHSGNILSNLMDQLDDMKRGEGARTVGDELAAVAEVSQEDQLLDAFVAGNIPDSVRVGDKGEE